MRMLTGITTSVLGSLRRRALRPAIGFAVLIGAALGTLASTSVAEAATAVSNVTVSITPPSAAAGATTVYTVGFKTSSSGALTSSSVINLTFPLATGVANLNGNTGVFVGTSQVGSCFDNSSTSPPTTAVQCTIFGGDSVAASTAVTVIVAGVVNPSAASYTLSVSTSSDTTAVTSPSYTVTAAKAVTSPTVSITPPSKAAGATTVYTVGFTTSSTGALSGTAGSVINLTFPLATGVANLNGNTGVFVGTSQVGSCFDNSTTSPPTTAVQCTIFGGDSVAASTAATVIVAGVVNPSAASYTLSVSTSSDTTAVTSPSYTVTAAKAVTSPTVSISPPSSAAGATTVYTLGFTTSSTGALSGTAGSVINVTFPAATGVGNLNGNTGVFVGTSEVGSCFDNSTTSPPTTAVQCTIFGGDSVAASTAATVIVAGVVNPSAASYTLSLSTSSDTTAVTSPSYTVTAAKSVSSPTLSLSKTKKNAVATYTLGFTTSTTGALSGTGGSVINVTFPTATGVSSLTGSTGVFVASTQVGSCFDNSTTSPPTTAVQCPIFGGDSVAASTAVTVVLAGVVNPPVGTYQLSLNTSSDVTAVNSPSYTITNPPKITSFTPTSGPVGQKVTITGKKFTGATNVSFNGVTAKIVSNTATTIVAKVPAGATTGKISVTTPQGTGFSATSFTVT